ncbi:MAG: hypothetical protein H0X17_25140, partial [Deltaproteobacteria bacterium]|nr:hypothetical protein [Deltaproteobacteria bacterium]
AVFRVLAARLGGRGGGKPERAEGRVTGAVTDWAAVVADVLDQGRGPVA